MDKSHTSLQIYDAHTMGVFLHCGASCPAHLNKIDRAIWAAIKIYWPLSDF